MSGKHKGIKGEFPRESPMHSRPCLPFLKNITLSFGYPGSLRKCEQAYTFYKIKQISVRRFGAEKLCFKSSKQAKLHRPNTTGRGGTSRAVAEAGHAYTLTAFSRSPSIVHKDTV